MGMCKVEHLLTDNDSICAVVFSWWNCARKECRGSHVRSRLHLLHINEEIQCFTRLRYEILCFMKVTQPHQVKMNLHWVTCVRGLCKNIDQHHLKIINDCFDVRFCLLRLNLIMHAHTDLCKAYKPLSCIRVLPLSLWYTFFFLVVFSAITSDFLLGEINKWFLPGMSSVTMSSSMSCVRYVK